MTRQQEPFLPRSVAQTVEADKKPGPAAGRRGRSVPISYAGIFLRIAGSHFAGNKLPGKIEKSSHSRLASSPSNRLRSNVSVVDLPAMIAGDTCATVAFMRSVIADTKAKSAVARLKHFQREDLRDRFAESEAGSPSSPRGVLPRLGATNPAQVGAHGRHSSVVVHAAPGFCAG
jgi:hypothetical protein